MRAYSLDAAQNKPSRGVVPEGGVVGLAEALALGKPLAGPIDGQGAAVVVAGATSAEASPVGAADADAAGSTVAFGAGDATGAAAGTIEAISSGVDLFSNVEVRDPACKR